MNIIKYLEEAIKLEFNASRLYLVFANYFEEDYNFWWKLSNEEMNHAALLKTGIEFAKINVIPDKFIPENVDDIIKLNNMFDDIIKEFEKNPNRQRCFEIALEIESSAEESHYQKIMDDNSGDKIIEIFKHLNKEDSNHYDRIKKYYSENIL